MEYFPSIREPESQIVSGLISCSASSAISLCSWGIRIMFLIQALDPRIQICVLAPLQERYGINLAGRSSTWIVDSLGCLAVSYRLPEWISLTRYDA